MQNGFFSSPDQAKLTGMALLAPQFSVGGTVGYNKTAKYSEFTAGVLLKFYFEQRAGLFESDLPDW